MSNTIGVIQRQLSRPTRQIAPSFVGDRVLDYSLNIQELHINGYKNKETPTEAQSYEAEETIL